MDALFGGQQQQTTQSGPPLWAVPYYQSAMSNANDISQQPYGNYNQDKVADFTSPQQDAFDMIYNRALNGSPNQGAADAAQGRFLSGGDWRPAQQTNAGWNSNGITPGFNSSNISPGWNGNDITPGFNDSRISAAWNGDRVAADANPYFGGNNPFLQSAIDSAQKDVTRGYQDNVVNTDSAANRAGAFGGSGWRDLQNRNVDSYTKNLGNLSNSMRMQDYTQQQQLGENAVNRSLQAQQYNSGLTNQNIDRQVQTQQFNSGIQDQNIGRDMQAQQYNSGLTNQNLDRSMQAQQFNSGIQDQNIARNMQAQQYNSGLTSQNLDRSLQSQQFNSSQDMNNWNTAMQRQQNALSMQPSLNQAAYQDANAMMGIGDKMQQQNQALLTDAFGRYQGAMDWPLRNQQILNQSLGINNGNTSTSSGGGASPVSQLGGLAMMAKYLGMFG